MYSSAYVWAKLVGYLETQLAPTLVSSWFDDTEVVELTDSKLIIYSPVPFHKDVIENRCASFIKRGMSEIFDTDIELLVFGEEELKAYQKKDASRGIDVPSPFSFEKFVVGSSNRFAHAAALAVAKEPAKSYNPLFIYGPSGVGKTHLLWAIAGKIQKDNPSANIVYIKGDQFTNELIDALKAGKNVEFRNKYRNAALFLMDDIQFIAGKESTQEEFFHTFNTLWENKRQIVMTADRPPREMLRLEDRLRTRFEWGLLADIQPPDYETRMAILSNKALSLGIHMPEDLCVYFAENLTTDVRKLEGAVKMMMAFHDLQGMPYDLETAARIVTTINGPIGDKVASPSLILSEVSRFYSIEEHIILGTRKNKGTAEARQVAMYLIRKLTDLSLPDIGHEFGRDHTTVLYSIRKIEGMLTERNNGLQDNIRDIMANINNKL